MSEEIKQEETKQDEVKDPEVANEFADGGKNDIENNNVSRVKKRKNFFKPVLMPVLFWVIFSALFYFASYELSGIKVDDIENSKILDIFQKYSVHSGLILGFLSMLIGYIIYLVLKIFKLTKFNFIFPILFSLLASPWYFFARQYVYFENRYTDLARAIIFYVAEPLLWVTKAVFVISIIWLIILTFRFILQRGVSKKAGMMAVLLISPLFLTGCTTIDEWACRFFDDPDHCLQNLAVQEADPDDCADIQGKRFQSSGSNPPRDKCYKRIAENTGDLGVCDNMEGGPYSYTKEECILNTSVKHENPSGCNMLSGSAKEECITKVSPSITSGGVIEIDEQIDLLEEELEDSPDEELLKQLEGLKQKKEDYLSVMSDNNKKEYESLTDPRNKQAAMDYYSGKIDRKSKDTLVELNNRLREQGSDMSDKEYEALRDVLAYKNDPENDIENMEPKEMLKLRWNEKLGNAVDYLKFWNSNPTEKEQKYDESLFIYQRMLERQEAINKGLTQKQQDMDRELGRVEKYIKDQVYEKVTDEVKKQAFGEMMDLVDSSASGPTTAVLGEAIDTVKKEAKSAEFRGLVRAYNLGMEEEISKAGGNIEKAHAMVAKNLEEDPYRYEDSHTFAHYQNILQNKDCDGSNPHCIKRDVFWKAMKKSYEYQNRK